MDLRSIREQLAQLNQTAISEIKTECEKIPQHNPKVTPVSDSPVLFTISLKDLDDDILSAEYYNYAHQRNVILKCVDRTKTLEECVELLERMCRDKKAVYQGETCLLHPNMVHWLQNILEEVQL